MRKPFIKIKLHSDVGGAPLGQKDLVIYYECNTSVKNFAESDILSYDDGILNGFVIAFKRDISRRILNSINNHSNLFSLTMIR